MFVLSDRPASVQAQFVSDDGLVPNSDFPAVIYKTAFSISNDLLGRGLQERLQTRFRRQGWEVDWVDNDAVYRYTHYHSTAFEALLVLGDVGEIEVGGRSGVRLVVSSGDVLFIPPGMAHRRVKGGKEFVVAGLYPQGQKWDLLRQNKTDYRLAKKNIPTVPLPAADPLYGKEGPLMRYWK